MMPLLLRRLPHRLARAGLRGSALLLALSLLAHGPPAPAQPPAAAEALHARRTALAPQLRANAFGQPLHLSSRQGDNEVEGDVHAEVPLALADLAAALSAADAVCEVLFLHQNVRACWPSGTAEAPQLLLTVGPKRASAQGSRYRLEYAMRVEAATPDYLRVTLSAPRGPLSTRNHLIVLEAVATGPGASFVHLGYRYGYGLLARIAMAAYLATAGRSKIGFTVTGRDADGHPIYLRGERAALERNVMRYFLALLAHRGVTAGTPQEQMAARLRAWFALTERYAAQLHELDLDEYLREKQDDLSSGQAHPP